MAQQERLFFLEDRDELWLTVKQRIAEISHSTPPLLWVTSPASPEWARHGRLQDLIFISSLLKSRLSWSVTSWLKLSRQTVKQKGSWVDRKVHWDTKPEAIWTFPRQNVPVTVVKSVIGPCMVSKHSCTVKKWTVQTMRVMTGKENTELPVQEDGLCLSCGRRCNFWALTNLSFSTWRVFEYYEQWSPEARDAHPKPAQWQISVASVHCKSLQSVEFGWIGTSEMEGNFNGKWSCCPSASTWSRVDVFTTKYPSGMLCGLLSGRISTSLYVGPGAIFFADINKGCLAILSWEQWNPEAKDAHPKSAHSNKGAAVPLQVFDSKAFQMLNLDFYFPVGVIWRWKSWLSKTHQ